MEGLDQATGEAYGWLGMSTRDERCKMRSTKSQRVHMRCLFIKKHDVKRMLWEQWHWVRNPFLLVIIVDHIAVLVTFRWQQFFCWFESDRTIWPEIIEQVWMPGTCKQEWLIEERKCQRLKSKQSHRTLPGMSHEHVFAIDFTTVLLSFVASASTF